MTDAPTEHVLTVVLVGRSRLAPRWAGERHARIVRVRDGLDALGELVGLGEAGPIAVVLEPGSIPASEVDEFIASARRVAPAAVILWAGAVEERIGRLPDGLLDESATIDDVLREMVRIRGGAMASQAAPRASPAGTPAAPLGGNEPFGAEQPCLRTLLAGGDVIGPAMARLRRALAPDDIRLILTSEGEARREAGAGEEVVAVAHRGRTLAWLVGPQRQRAALEDASHWLAVWIAVQEQHAQLKAAALTDHLTGAWNRRYLDRYLAGAVERARRDRRDVTLLLFDIDNFKDFNDRFGHVAGDEILREVVALLRSVVRATDRVCRVGGDEFAVVFDDPDRPSESQGRHPSSIQDVALRFQKQIREHRFPKLAEEARGTLTISGGLATFPWDAHDPAGLMERADRLLLEAKKQGKGIISIGPPRDDPAR